MKNRLLAISILILISAILLSACSDAERNDNPLVRAGTNEPVSRGSGAAIMHGMFPFYASSDALFDRATDVFRGKVIDSRVERVNILLSAAELIEHRTINYGLYTSEEQIHQWLMDEYYGRGLWYDTAGEHMNPIMTVYRIKVLEVFQGNYQIGDIVEVAQHGGSLGHSSLSFDAFIPLEANDDVVIFMVSMSRFGQPGYFLTPWQSVYFFPAAEGRSGTLNLDEELGTVLYCDGRNPINLTLNDLLQLSPFDDFTMARNGEWEPTYAPPAERQVRVMPTPAPALYIPSAWVPPCPYEMPDPTPYVRLEPCPTLPPLDEGYFWYFPSPSCPPIVVYHGLGPTLSPEAIANPPSPSPSSD